MDSKQAYDAVVVGAGVIGLACAHALRQSGASVCVVEQYLVGSGQSTRTGGGIRLAHGSAVNVELTRLSLPTWRDFASRFGVDPQFHEIGHLFLSRQQADAGASPSGRPPAYSGTTRNLDAAAVQALWPQLQRGSFVAASYCESGGYLDQFAVIQGYQQTLHRSEVVFEQGLRVEGLLMSGDPRRVCGVRTRRGDIPASLVVNAAGAGAGTVAGFAGLSIPFRSRRHELLIVRGDIGGPAEFPWLIDVDLQVHLRPDGAGRALIGGFLGRDEEVDPDRYAHENHRDWVDEVRIAATKAFGLTRQDCEILAGWAGLYPGTSDYLPVLEMSLPGMITAAGFSGTGLMHAPAVGQIVSLLAQGRTDEVIDISSLAASRFNSRSVAQEQTGF